MGDGVLSPGFHMSAGPQPDASCGRVYDALCGRWRAYLPGGTGNSVSPFVRFAADTAGSLGGAHTAAFRTAWNADEQQRETSR